MLESSLENNIAWSESARGRLDRRRAVGQVHRIGHRDNDLAGSLEGFSRVRGADVVHQHQVASLPTLACGVCLVNLVDQLHDVRAEDRKSTRLNSSHLVISYAVFCLKKKKKRQVSISSWTTRKSSVRWSTS